MLAEASWTVVLVEKVLIPVATAAGIALAGFVTVWINKLSKKAGIDLTEKQRCQVDDAVEKAIMHTMQTFTDSARAAAADGKLTKDDAIKALKLTKLRAVVELESLGKTANGVATSLLKDENKLKEKIESLLPQVRSKTSRGIAALSKDDAKKLLAVDNRAE